jgi:hypothetical protein
MLSHHNDVFRLFEFDWKMPVFADDAPVVPTAPAINADRSDANEPDT